MFTQLQNARANAALAELLAHRGRPRVSLAKDPAVIAAATAFADQSRRVSTVLAGMLSTRSVSLVKG